MSAATPGAVALVGAMLARSIRTPIDRVVQRARLIGESGLDTRLPHPGGRDEIARLVGTQQHLSNAVRFSPPGGRVRVGVSTEAGEAVVAVSDSGPGIPEAERPRLFERFYRGSAARRTDVPDVGLELAICRVLVEGQCGSIAVSNSPRGGATVSVRLPLAA